MNEYRLNSIQSLIQCAGTYVKKREYYSLVKIRDAL